MRHLARRLILLLFILLLISSTRPIPMAHAGGGATPRTQIAQASGQSSGQTSNQTSKQVLEGIWLGVLDVGGITLRLALKVTKGPDGKLWAKVDSLDQDATDLTVDTLTFTDGHLSFEMKAIRASYEGTMNREGTEITGQFTQGVARPLVLKRVDRLPSSTRPQDPQKPYPYDEEEVTYENKRDKVKIAGTLTKPRSRGPYPAVLLITGSGAQDRNEALLGHRPFLVLSDYLTRHGIAVLRVDDRGVGGTTRGTPGDTDENYAEDVLAGVEFLKSRSEVNPRQIGLVGHSEGGLIAPMVAARSKDVAFIVLIAGPGMAGEQLLLAQNELLAKAAGASPLLRAQSRTALTRLFAILREEKDNAIADKKIRAALAEQLNQMTEEQKKAFAPVKAIIEQQLIGFVTAWFRYLLAYDPRPVLMQVKCPVLAVNGERDLQVPPDENLAIISAALKAGGNTDYTVVKLPQLNHLLQTSKTGAISEYRTIEETIAPSALELITDWILKHTTGANTARGAASGG